jgi:uncharacterized protein with NRDE domain
MCTVVILRRPGHDWPVLIAANRDEMGDRPSAPPGRHWPDRVEVRAGLDRLAGGSWLGLNDWGVVAAVMNRTGSLGPAPGKRSRGELALEALDHADAASAAAALADLEASAYRPFNLLVADNRDAYWIAGLGEARPVTVKPIPEGLSMLTAHDLNSAASPRVRFHRPRFLAAAAPDPGRTDWKSWIGLMAAREHAPDADMRGAMNISTGTGFGTVSSALIALPKPGQSKPIWLYADGPPDRAPYLPVAP